MNVPYKTKRFPGYKASEADEENRYNPEVHAERILGGHIADYMRELEKDAPETMQSRFGKYVEAGLGPDDLEEMYRNVHKAIRSKPDREKKTPKTYQNKKRWNRAKLTLKQRKDRVNQLKKNFANKMRSQIMADED